MQINDKKILFAFWFFVIFSIQAIISFLYSYNLKLKVKGFSYPLEAITMTVSMKKPVRTNYFVCFDEYCQTLEHDTFLKNYSIKYDENNPEFLKSKVRKIYLQNTLNNNIESVFVCIGNKSYYFNQNDLSKFETKTSTLELQDKKKQTIGLSLLPVKENYKGIYNNLSNVFLSIFYNWHTGLIVPYFWLFIAFLLWVFNKDKFKFKINYIWTLALFIIIGAILRGNFLTYNPLWLDEIYTKEVAIKSFASCFQDAGNPPLFFILEYLFTKIFSTSVLSLRFLPYLFSILTIPLVYLFLKDVDKNMALFGSFFMSINLISICHGDDARSYSLVMFLGILSIHTLFKYLKNPNNKNLIIYTLTMILTVNSHYYLLIFTFVNFIWGAVDLISNKNKIIKFIIANFIAFLSFLPYFIAVHSTALNSDFNLWIGKFSSESFKYLINEFFINKYIFIFLALIVLINLIFVYLPIKNDKIKINKEKENLFIYLIYSLAFILIIVSFISLYIKPIFNKRIFLSVYSLLFLLEVLMISRIFVIEKVNKIFKTVEYLYSFALILICLTITKPMPFENIYQLDEFMNLINNDSIQYKNDYEIHIITNITKDYINNFEDIKDKDYIIWDYVNANGAWYLKNIKKSNYTKAKKAVFYTNAMSADISLISRFNPKANVYKTNSIPIMKVVYEE